MKILTDTGLMVLWQRIKDLNKKISVSAKQTTTSTADGGTNVMTFTFGDGTSTTLSVKNGSKGSDGARGETGAKGETGDRGPIGETGPQGNSGIADASNKPLINDVITGGGTNYLSAEVGKLGILNYDCSKGGYVTHATLQDAINSVPTTFQKVGLTITYKSGDTIYRYVLKANTWSADPANWFSVEDKLNGLLTKASAMVNANVTVDSIPENTINYVYYVTKKVGETISLKNDILSLNVTVTSLEYVEKGAILKYNLGIFGEITGIMIVSRDTYKVLEVIPYKDESNLDVQTYTVQHSGLAIISCRRTASTFYKIENNFLSDGTFKYKTITDIIELKTDVENLENSASAMVNANVTVDSIPENTINYVYYVTKKVGETISLKNDILSLNVTVTSLEYVEKGAILKYNLGIFGEITGIMIVSRDTYKVLEVIPYKDESNLDVQTYTVQHSGLAIISCRRTASTFYKIENNFLSDGTFKYKTITDIIELKTDVENLENSSSAMAKNYLFFSLSMFRKILFLGDSVTEGLCIKKSANLSKTLINSSYPACISRALNISCVNLGQSGQVIEKYLDAKRVDIDSNISGSDACFIELGWNITPGLDFPETNEAVDADLASNVKPYGDNYDNYKTTNSVIASYCKIVKYVQQKRPGISIFLVSSFGWNPIASKNYAIKKIAEWGNCIYIDGANDTLKPDSGDPAHFTPFGYAEKAAHVCMLVNNINEDDKLKIFKNLIQLDN